MNKILKQLRKKKFVVGVKVNLRFPLKRGGYGHIQGKRGTEVVKWTDILKAFRGKNEKV